MNETMMKVVMIVLLSALFPLVGFYLDWRANKKRLGSTENAIKKTISNKDVESQDAPSKDIGSES